MYQCPHSAKKIGDAEIKQLVDYVRTEKKDQLLFPTEIVLSMDVVTKCGTRLDQKDAITSPMQAGIISEALTYVLIIEKSAE